MRHTTTLLALLLAAPAAHAEVPIPSAYPQCGQGGECPSDFDDLDRWYLASTIPEEVGDNVPADQQSKGAGVWADRAWNYTTGRPDVVIAILDSGFDWNSGQLVNKWYLNAAELPEPQDASGESTAGIYDLNGDGVFNMRDWADDPRLSPDLGNNPNGCCGETLDPSDLIALFSDGVDDDGNGYIDDISGWDFFWNDNNASDDRHHDGYSHGTKEGRWSSAEGNNGGEIGACPNCRVLPLRASDGFVADVNNFALGAQYAVDQGASVIQEALGALNNTTLTQQAVEYAWQSGVTIMASAADETSYHHNPPGANHHTVYVHAIRHDSPDTDNAHTFLAFSNCTNFGPRLALSVSAEGCSSGATGISSGVAGLVYSAMKDALDVGTLDTPLSSNEVYQLLTTTALDIDHNPDGAFEQEYPSREGWDRYFGYGKLNAHAAVEAVVEGAIPPEADLLSPGWFDYFQPDHTSSVAIEGHVAAPRSESYSWELQVGGGDQPDAWTSVATGQGSEPTDGVLATLDLSQLPIDPSASVPQWQYVDTAQDRAEVLLTRWTVTLRLRVTDDQGRRGEVRKSFYVQRDPDLLPGLPRKVAVSLEASPTLADVNGDGVDDLVYVTSDGEVFVTDASLMPYDGWPQAFPLLQEHDPSSDRNHLAAAGYTSGALTDAQHHAALSSPAVADLDGDGEVEIVAASLNGSLYVFHADGSTAAGWPFTLDLEQAEGRITAENAYDYGFFSSPALGDLDGDGDLEIVLGAMDAHVYAFHHDGSAVSGFPVELRHEYETSEGPRSAGDRIISSPALGDIDGDGHLDIVIGTNQKTTGTYGLGYALEADGSIKPGWPATLFGAYTDALPYVGEGVPGSPTLCDVDGDGTLEIGMHTIADAGRLLSYDGTEFASLARIANDFGPGNNTSESAASIIMVTSGAWGDLDVDGVPDYLIGGTGLEYAAGLLDDGKVHDFDHLLGAYSGGAIFERADGTLRMPYLDAFPRVMEDLQFFLNPGVADIDGDGLPEALHGSAGSVLHAFDYTGAEPEGWPKFTGQWILGSPAVGDVDGDGYLDVWAVTRDGYVFGWATAARADTSSRQWVGFRHDARHTGNCHTDLRSYPPLPEEEPGCGSCESEASVAGGAGSGLGGLALAGLLVARRRR